MKGLTTRLRRGVATHFSLVLIGLLIVGLVGGYATYQVYVNPETETETRVLSSWESAGEFDHRATVINGTAAFEEGTVLHNRTAYFRNVSPRLDGAFSYRYTASNGGRLATNVSLAIVLRSVEDRPEGNQTVFWRIERPLRAVSVEALEPGETARIPFSVNVTARKQVADAVEEQLGDPPGTPRMHILARVGIDGTRNGEPVERTRSYRLPIQFEQGVYQVSAAGPELDSDRRTRTTSDPVQYGAVRTVGGPLLALLGLGGVVGAVVARRQGRLALAETERVRHKYEIDRAEFADWITTGHVPDELADRPHVRVDSLEGLVDTAIDTDERVIEDPVGERYLVISEAVTYEYDPPSIPQGYPLPPQAARTDAQGTDGEAPSGNGHDEAAVPEDGSAE